MNARRNHADCRIASARTDERAYDDRACVYLELADATPAQAEQGMAPLKKLAG